MPRIKFTRDPKLPRDLAHLGYKAGDEVDLTLDQAERWIRRGVAEIVAPKPRGRTKPQPSAPAPTELLGVAGAPATVPLGPDRQLAFADLVVAAHARSGLTVDAWNALSEGERDSLLRVALEEIRQAPPSA